MYVDMERRFLEDSLCLGRGMPQYFRFDGHDLSEIEEEAPFDPIKDQAHEE
jgi:hypothetical protein